MVMETNRRCYFSYANMKGGWEAVTRHVEMVPRGNLAGDLKFDHIPAPGGNNEIYAPTPKNHADQTSSMRSPSRPWAGPLVARPGWSCLFEPLPLSHTRARHTRRHTTNRDHNNNNTTTDTPRSPRHPRTPSRNDARENNPTASKGTAHRPAERGRKHEPGDAHASPGTAATATMAGPRNAWPAQNSAGSSRPRSW